MVSLAIFPQDSAVEKDGFGGVNRASSEMPRVRRKHPRPAEQIARANRVHDHRVAEAFPGLEHHFAALYQVKAVGDLTFAQNNLTGLEVRSHSAIRQQRQLRPVHSS